MKARGGHWLSGTASVLSSAVALVCPVCIPALGALLASVGLGGVVSTGFLRGLLLVLLAASIGSLAWATCLHRRWSVLAVGLGGAAFLYVGRHVWFSAPLMWVGAATLIGASLANVRTKRTRCPCEAAEKTSP